MQSDSLLNQLNKTESTVNGGKGDDTIVADGFGARVFQYADGDGNDVIEYFAMNKAYKEKFNLKADATHMSTLHITKGLVKEISLDGNDVIVKVGKGSIRLVDTVGRKFKLREADGYTTTRSYSLDSNGEIICTIMINFLAARVTIHSTVAPVKIHYRAAQITINFLANLEMILFSAATVKIHYRAAQITINFLANLEMILFSAATVKIHYRAAQITINFLANLEMILFSAATVKIHYRTAQITTNFMAARATTY